MTHNMSRPVLPVASSPRRSYSGPIDVSNALRSSSTKPRSRADSSSSSSDSSYTLQTPQSPSIMAVLDFGRKRADSYPLLRNDHQELFETTLSHRESLSVISGELCGIKTRLSHADGASGPYHGSQLSGTGIASAPYRDPVESGLSNGEGGSPSTPDPDNGRLNFPHAEAHDIPTQVGLRSKRGNPASMSLDTAHPDQSDHHGAKQGRRLRPRLRSIISAPLASSRHSSSSTLARLAGALSSRKPSMESVVDTVNPPSSITSPCPPSTPPSSRLKSRNQSVGGRDDTIWMQRKHSSSIAKTPRSPIPASRSIPPTLQRGITSPILALPQLSASVALKEPAPRLDHFERILPRELQVMIMSKLLEDGASRERDRRWSGAVGARRELIRLSRVSKSWRSLCFDGQLWADVDLAPFAAHLSARTLRHIVNHTAPFISSLSLRGMRSLPDVDLLPSLARFGLAQAMPTLTTLGLQCCKIDSHTIIAVIKNAPRLRRINLKGVQTVNLDVLYCLASYSKMLESLDVSGCWHISLEDVRSFVDLLDDDSAGRLNTLRLAVVHSKTEGPIPADLLVSVFGRLRNLETVNLQGCRQLLSTMLIAACEGLRMQSRTSAIRHLNLSGCTGLRADVLLSMNGLFPELRYLEMAGMPAFFQENSRSDRTAFNRFLQSCPFLERLDIEETAGTSVDDSTLRTLARMSHLTHLQIGFASSITPEAMVGFIRGCPSLQVLHADNTQANGAVIREFQRSHPEDGKLSLIDCRAISAADYLRVAGVSRPREGFTEYAAIPMGYSPVDLQEKVVIKTFWSWRRVSVARGWRETLAEKERELAESGADIDTVSGQQGGGRAGRSRGWRRKDDSYDAKGLCVVQ